VSPVKCEGKFVDQNLPSPPPEIHKFNSSAKKVNKNGEVSKVLVLGFFMFMPFSVSETLWTISLRFSHFVFALDNVV
jgi:hypothetical protein